MTDTALRSIDWARTDPFVRGPWGSSEAPGREFRVPESSSDGIRVVDVRSGPAYPETVRTLGRAIPIPDFNGPSPQLAASPDDPSVVLSARNAAGGWDVVCALDDGAVRWAFDPCRWIEGVLSEAYVTDWTRPWVSRLPVNYARAPSWLRAPFQRMSGPVEQESGTFPKLPFDDLVETLRALCAVLHGGSAPIRELWPGGAQAAVSVTHDVDTGWVFESRNRQVFERLLGAEEALGFRGGWFIPAAFFRPTRHAAAVAALERAGHELGAHGWNHDARLQYLDRSRQERRMERIARRFGTRKPVGMRTPWYGRDPALFDTLDAYFDYDSSVPNASGIFSRGTNSGCCTVFPYRPVPGLLELPLTLPPDNFADWETGYASLRSVTEAIVAQRGVVVVILHPQPHQSGNPEGLAHFERFLSWIDATFGASLWKATPAAILDHYEGRIAPTTC